ncbi:MAG: lysozyme [Betaproteobacteria bacterium]|nr:lysozyme [Betaproteobacteria bacterium]
MQYSQGIKRPLSMIVGLAAATAITAGLHLSEGDVRRTYLDSVGIPTNCMGNTHGARLGQTFTKAECAEIDEKNMADTAAGVDACTPLGELPAGRRAAAVMFAFNVGVPAYCGSGFARRLRARDPGACAELDKWIYADGRAVPGLAARRKRERAICERTDL